MPPGLRNPRNVRRRVALVALWITLLLVAGLLGFAICHHRANTTSSTANHQATKVVTDQPDSPTFRCATPGLSSTAYLVKRAQPKKFETSEKDLEQTTVIRVFFHVITKGDDPSEGNITEQQISDQIEVLNQKFGAITPAFEFVLDKTDRRRNLEWYQMQLDSDAEMEAMRELGYQEKDVLNVYTAEVADTLGWAIYPWNFSPDPPYRDGVVIRFSTLPGGSELHYEQGMTLVHEVGHWLGLLHTYETGCFPPGDGVDDTAAEMRMAGAQCPMGRNSCSDNQGPDPVDNFMDSSPDSCVTRFTAGQLVRMHEKFEACRRPGGNCSP